MNTGSTSGVLNQDLPLRSPTFSFPILKDGSVRTPGWGINRGIFGIKSKKVR